MKLIRSDLSKKIVVYNSSRGRKHSTGEIRKKIFKQLGIMYKINYDTAYYILFKVYSLS